MNRRGGKRKKWTVLTVLTNQMLWDYQYQKKMKPEQPEKVTAFENIKQGKINKPCPQIARSSGRDHQCAVLLPHICFAAWLCTVVYVEKAVCVYHLWPRSMRFLTVGCRQRLSDAKVSLGDKRTNKETRRGAWMSSLPSLHERSNNMREGNL